MLVGLRVPVGLRGEDSETGVAVGDKRPHAQRSREGEGLTVDRLSLGVLAPCTAHVAEEP